MTYLWVAAFVIVVITLLYLELTALLYVLATVGMTILLVIVALADLSGAHSTSSEPVPADDAAAIGTGIATSMPPPTTASAPRAAPRPTPRASKRK
jgi:hypothetical protein